MVKESIKKILTICMAVAVLITTCFSLHLSTNAEERGITMYVATRNMVLHEERNNDSPSIMIPYREKVTLLDEKYSTGRWLYLEYNGKEYYTYNKPDVILLKEELVEPSFKGNNEYADAILQVAKKIYYNWNTSYGHNASDGVKKSDGTYAFDCSGFVSYVYTTALSEIVPTYYLSKNIDTLYETTSVYNKGFKNEGKVVEVLNGDFDESKLEPGDVLFFKLTIEGNVDNKKYNHCAIYLGNGEIIHSSHSFDGKVRLMPLEGAYEEGFVCAKRYYPSSMKPANEKQYTKCSSTNIYVEKDSNKKVLKTIGLIDTVTVLYTDNGNWSYVKLANGKKGYVLSRNICKKSKISISCTTRSNGIKLYKEQSTRSKSITVNRGTKLTLKGKSGNYYKVKYKNKTYYIYTTRNIASLLTTY